MRIYSEASEETLRARRLLKEWTGDGLLTTEQYRRLEQETPSDLRVTNIFLRLVLFFFTLLVLAAGAGLFFAISRPAEKDVGILLLVFSVVCYVAAETSVKVARLYRYGIEEALAACSVAFLCVGLDLSFFSHAYDVSRSGESVVPAVTCMAALWIWYRFHLWYAFPVAMISAVFIPSYWMTPRAEQLVFVAALYAVGLACIAAVRGRHRFDAFENAFSLAEAFLWFGIYLTFNLKISALSLPIGWLSHTWPASDVGHTFYWMTWVLIWCLPALVLARGIRQRDRYVMAAGAIVAVLTLATNKPYLGWKRHSWDPMLLGIVLTGVAWYLRRWLDRGPGGIRHGFTAARLSGKDKHMMDVGSAVLGLTTPHSITPTAQPASPDERFGGGSGGGGASGDF